MYEKTKKCLNRIVCFALFVLWSVSLCVGVVFAETMTDAITEWLPTIIQFAMLGMIMGLLKKMGKW